MLRTTAHLPRLISRVTITLLLALASMPLLGSSASAIEERPMATRDVDGTVYAVLQVGSTLYLGGSFTQVGNVDVSNLAAIDLGTMNVVRGWRPRTNGPVFALAANGKRIFVGGSFSRVGTRARANIAAISRTGTVLRRWSPSTNGPVRSLVIAQRKLFVGGGFTSVNGASHLNLARLSLRTGRPDSGWRPRTNGTVHALAVGLRGRLLYVGGAFGTAGGSNGASQRRRNLAAFTTRTGALHARWRPDLRVVVFHLASNNGRVYAAAGGSGGNLVAYNRRSVMPGNRIWAVHTDGDVQAVAVSGNRIYAGGHFDSVCDRSGAAITRCPSGSSLVARRKLFVVVDQGPTADLQPWSPGSSGQVWELRTQGGVLNVGGRFSTIGGEPREGFARFANA